MTTLTMDGGKELQAALLKYGQALADAVDEVAEDAALNINTDVVQAIIQGPKTGRIYKRGGVFHQASAPGQAPASDTGALVASIQTNKVGDGVYEVSSRMKYAEYLEFGTRKMAPRPAWVPAVEKERPEFMAAIRAEIARLSK